MRRLHQTAHEAAKEASAVWGTELASLQDRLTNFKMVVRQRDAAIAERDKLKTIIEKIKHKMSVSHDEYCEDFEQEIMRILLEAK